MKQFLKEKQSNIWKELKMLARLFWMECYAPALLVNLVIEMLSRKSVWEAFLYVIKTPTIFFYNALIIAATFSLGLFFKRQRFVQALLCVLWLGIGVIDFVLLQFRTTPFTYVDVLLIDSALSIMQHYLAVWQIVLIGLGVLLVGAGCVYLFLHSPKKKQEISRLGCCLFFILLFCSVQGFTSFGVHIQLLERNFGNIAQAFHTNGLPYCFMNSVFGMGIEKPEDYSNEVVQGIVDSLEQVAEITPPLSETLEPTLPSDSGTASESEKRPTGIILEPGHIGLAQDPSLSTSQETASKPESPAFIESIYPNVLFLQLESFFDPTLLEGMEFTTDPVPVFRKLKENYTSGYLSVPSFGAGTANTEFEILTGMNLDFFGPGEYPYKTILQDKTCESLAFNLSALGLIPHAIHNNDATFYGRNHVFSQLGFSTFISMEYMSGYEKTPLGWAKDSCLTEVIVDALQSTKEQDFIYTISVQGHGAYPEEALLTNPVIDISLPEQLKEYYYPILYYVNQLYEMDLFLEELVDVLDSYSEDVVLVLYGDHLPTFPFTDEMLTNGSIYETEYIVWSNFAMEQEQVDLQAYQLSAYVLGRLDIHEGLLTKYHQTNFSQVLSVQSENQEVEVQDTKDFQKNLSLVKELEEDYLKNMQILEYDMLYGNMDCYNGINPYEPSDLKLGLHTIQIDSALLHENKTVSNESLLYIKGENFTEFSVVCLNGELRETFYVNDTTLYVKQAELDEVLEIVVKQIGKDGEVLSETEPFYFEKERRFKNAKSGLQE